MSHAGRTRYTDPVENLRTYIMAHPGIDKDERLTDVTWLSDVVAAARDVVNAFGEDQSRQAVEALRAALRA